MFHFCTLKMSTNYFKWKKKLNLSCRECSFLPCHTMVKVVFWFYAYCVQWQRFIFPLFFSERCSSSQSSARKHSPRRWHASRSCSTGFFSGIQKNLIIGLSELRKEKVAVFGTAMKEYHFFQELNAPYLNVWDRIGCYYGFYQ